MKIEKIIVFIFYACFCLLVIDLSSWFEEEYYIDGRSMKNVCDIYEALVVDDIRVFTAPMSFLFMSPLIYFAFKKKLKSKLINITTLVVLIYWVWRFFLRLYFCI